MKRIIFIFFICLIFSMPSFAKKKKVKVPKMVETVEEYQEISKAIPVTERNNKVPQRDKTTKKIFYPEPKYIFETYNYPAGSRENNIDDIKKWLIKNPTIVADRQCKYVAYTRYYFNPTNNQISSEFFVEKLDPSLSKKIEYCNIRILLTKDYLSYLLG